MLLSGIISDALGWEAPFYVLGALELAWFICWILLISDTPAEHKRISEVRKL